MVLGNSDAFLLDPDAGARGHDGATARRSASGASRSSRRRTSSTCARSRRRSRSTSTACGCSASTASPATTTTVVLPEDPPDAFAGTGADLLAGGHVHVPQLRRVGNGPVHQPGQRRARLRPPPARGRLPLRRVGLVRDRRGAVGRVPPRALRPRGARRQPHARADCRSRRKSPAATGVPRGVRLYNSQLSGNCWKVRQILALRGIEYERVEVDVFDRSNRPELLGGKNPALRVPTLELDDGQFLAESNAILWYFGDGSPYLPDDALDRARVLQWMFFEQYEVEPSIAVARFWIALLGEREKYAEELEAKWRAGNRALAALDGHLDGPRLARRRRLHDRRHLALRVHARGAGRWVRARRVTRRSRRGSSESRRCRATSRSTRRRRRGDRLVAQLRRYVVAHQGYATRFRRARADDVASTIQPSRLRPARLDLDRRTGAPADAGSRIGALPGGVRLAPAEEGPHLRVLGARGLSRPDRGLPALQAAHGASRASGTGGDGSTTTTRR